MFHITLNKQVGGQETKPERRMLELVTVGQNYLNNRKEQL